METRVKVGDLMTRNFIWTTPETDLKKCAKIMLKRRVGSLIIKEKDSDKLKGILTEKDIVWAVIKKSKKDLSKIMAKDIMKRKVHTIKPGADIVDALKKIEKKKVRRLPVVENKQVIGMLTTKDIFKVSPDLFESIAETVKIREESDKLKKHQRGKPRKLGVCEECGEQDLLTQDDGAWICSSCYDKR
jgi:CBS domain-containing protein